MAVPIDPASGSARARLPVRLFQVEARTYRSFAVAPDGQRFLINPPNPTASRRPTR